uniref:casein kinase I-like isoform X3 n=1 Tax=Myxine glutinosa TaxID=7769 RepID=UPI0035901B40
MEFGKWEVISKIGEGSSGFVYKAKNVNSAEEVALKKARSLGGSIQAQIGSQPWTSRVGIGRWRWIGQGRRKRHFPQTSSSPPEPPTP